MEVKVSGVVHILPLVLVTAVILRGIRERQIFLLDSSSSRAGTEKNNPKWYESPADHLGLFVRRVKDQVLHRPWALIEGQ